MHCAASKSFLPRSSFFLRLLNGEFAPVARAADGYMPLVAKGGATTERGVNAVSLESKNSAISFRKAASAEIAVDLYNACAPFILPMASL